MAVVVVGVAGFVVFEELGFDIVGECGRHDGADRDAIPRNAGAGGVIVHAINVASEDALGGAEIEA